MVTESYVEEFLLAHGDLDGLVALEDLLKDVSSAFLRGGGHDLSVDAIDQTNIVADDAAEGSGLAHDVVVYLRFGREQALLRREGKVILLIESIQQLPEDERRRERSSHNGPAVAEQHPHRAGMMMEGFPYRFSMTKREEMYFSPLDFIHKSCVLNSCS